MFDFLVQHQSWTAVAIYWGFSAAVSSMPEPAANGSSGYLWLYRFLHTTAGNITTAFANKIPGLKNLIVLLMIPLVFSASACAGHYTVHPGAFNEADSAAYDALRIAEATIDQVRLDYQAQELPASTKDAFNTLFQSYNIARESWLTYRGAIAAERERDSAQPQTKPVPADMYFNQLNQNLTDLANAIRAYRGAK